MIGSREVTNVVNNVFVLDFDLALNKKGKSNIFLKVLKNIFEIWIGK